MNITLQGTRKTRAGSPIGDIPPFSGNLTDNKKYIRGDLGESTRRVQK